MINLYNRERNNSRTQSLANALQAARVNPNVQITAFQPVHPLVKAKEESALGGAGSLLGGAGNLYNGLKASGLLDKTTTSTESPIASAINNNVFGNSETVSPIASAINNSVMGTTEASPISSAISSSVGSSGFNGMPLIGNAIGGLNGLGSTGSWQGGLQGMFGVNEDDSDVMQGINGTLNGGLTGFSVGGPIGAAIGAALGLGSSFLDDF